MFYVSFLFFIALMVTGGGLVRYFCTGMASGGAMTCFGYHSGGKRLLVYLALFAGAWQWALLPGEGFVNAAVSGPVEVHVLSGPNDHVTIPNDGHGHLVYGTTGNNQVTVQQGAAAHLRHFLGENTINIQTDISQCVAVRSGAMVTIRDEQYDTQVKIPATTQNQTLNFNGGARSLQIIGGQVFIGDLQIDLEEQALVLQPGQERTIDLGDDVSLILVWVPEGSFQMGRSISDIHSQATELPCHGVNLTQGFWMGKFEVTQGQWKHLMGENPSYFQGEDAPVGANPDNLPVEQVSWEDIQEFMDKLNTRTELTFSLPTEAQWEYAARGNADPLEKYSGSDDVKQVGWYHGDASNKTTHEVGLKDKNNWNLHDMSGNVFEWCKDWYGHDYYKYSPSTDPQGPDSGDSYVIRGGSWTSKAHKLRCAYRSGATPDMRDRRFGFRVVLQP